MKLVSLTCVDTHVSLYRIMTKYPSIQAAFSYDREIVVNSVSVDIIASHGRPQNNRCNGGVFVEKHCYFIDCYSMQETEDLVLVCYNVKLYLTYTNFRSVVSAVFFFVQSAYLSVKFPTCFF